MKCLYIPIRAIYGGAERRLVRIFNEFDHSDWCLVLCGKADDVECFCDRENILKEYVQTFECERDVVRYLRRKEISLIWFFNFDRVIVKTMMLSRKTYLMTIANYYFSVLSFKTLKSKLLFYYVFHRANIIDCLFPSSASMLKSRYCKKSIFVTPIPFTKSDIYKPAANKNRTIVFASRLVEEKNIMVLLESIKQLRDYLESKMYKLIICGDGPLKTQVLDTIENGNLYSIVEYLGNINTATVFPNSSIFVSIMTGENYPSQSLIEAISAGNYCIVGRGKDTNKLIKKEFGMEIDISVDNLSKELKRAIDVCEIDHQSVVLSAKEFAQDNFNIRNSVDYFEQLTKDYK